MQWQGDSPVTFNLRKFSSTCSCSSYFHIKSRFGGVGSEKESTPQREILTCILFSTSAQWPTQWGPTQKRTQGEYSQFFFLFAPRISCLASATVAKIMWFSIRKSSALLKRWILMVASVVKNLPWSGWLSCVDGPSVDGPSGSCIYSGEFLASCNQLLCITLTNSAGIYLM